MFLNVFFSKVFLFLQVGKQTFFLLTKAFQANFECVGEIIAKVSSSALWNTFSGKITVMNAPVITLVEAACKFSKIFYVAYTFYKILENESKFLYALQSDCSMDFFRCPWQKIYAFSMQHTKLFASSSNYV